jgi:hypothetical protein
VTFGLAIPYSPEFINNGVDRRLLADMAAQTGGAVIDYSGTSLTYLLTPNPSMQLVGERVWWPLLLAALILMVVEVGLRKLPTPIWLAARLAERRRSVGRDAPSAEPAYDALVASIAESRNRHIAALRHRGGYRSDDPAVRARLYHGGCNPLL